MAPAFQEFTSILVYWCHESTDAKGASLPCKFCGHGIATWWPSSAKLVVVVWLGGVILLLLSRHGNQLDKIQPRWDRQTDWQPEHRNLVTALHLPQIPQLPSGVRRFLVLLCRPHCSLVGQCKASRRPTIGSLSAALPRLFWALLVLPHKIQNHTDVEYRAVTLRCSTHNIRAVVKSPAKIVTFRRPNYEKTNTQPPKRQKKQRNRMAGSHQEMIHTR